MSLKNAIVSTLCTIFAIVFNTSFAQDTYTISIDSTTFIFGRTCFVTNWEMNDTLVSTDFSEIVNDTVYSRGYQEPGQPPQSWNYILSPSFPTVGSEWIGVFAGPARFVVQDYTSVTVPAGTFNAYIYEITDTLTGEYKGTMTVAENIGTLSFLQIFQGDTFSMVLNTYTILGGYGVMPLFIGNEWIMIDVTLPNEIKNATSNNPSNYSLTQNYPNPFNPSTKISYQIPELGFVSLKVYDVLGNEIATLVNEEKSVGTHEIVFNTNDIPSGIYFYKINAGNYTETKKMVLLK